MLTLATKKE